LVETYLAQVPAEKRSPLAVEHLCQAPLIDLETGRDYDVPLVGLMDLVAVTDDGPVIVDFKSMPRAGAPLERAHEIRLSCYAYLFRQHPRRRHSSLRRSMDVVVVLSSRTCWPSRPVSTAGTRRNVGYHELSV
jgi:PD-(D/E)XK nuclease superfamily protein